MQGNQRTSLSLAQAQRHNMAAYDRLPPALRRWLAEAKLPWSPASARRAWRKALWRNWGREAAALAYMDALEEARLAQDALVMERELACARLSVAKTAVSAARGGGTAVPSDGPRGADGPAGGPVGRSRDVRAGSGAGAQTP